MPELNFQVREVNHHVLDRVAEQLVRALVVDLGVTHVFDSNNTTIRTDRSGDGNSSDGEGGIRVSDDRCDVSVSQVTNPAQLRWDILNFTNSVAYGRSVVDRVDTIPLLRDAVAGVSLYEYMKPCNLRLSFSMKFKNKDDAQRAEGILTSRYHAASVFNMHDVTYAYPIDIQLATALYVLYKMRTSYTGAHSFMEWLQGNASKEIAFERSKDASQADQKRLVIKRTNLNAIALLEYSQEQPEAVAAQFVTDRWEIQFTYTLQFTRPDTFNLVFPTVIENALVPNTVLPDMEPEDYLAARSMEGILSQTSFTHMVRKFNAPFKNIVVRIPYYETFYPNETGPIKAHGYRPFLISAFTLGEGATTTIDLVNLAPGEIDLDPTTIEIMKLHGSDIFGTTGLFNISIFANGVLVAPSRLSVDENLVVSVSATDALLRYHIVLSETTELKHIDNKYMSMMAQYRWFFATSIAKSFNYLLRSGYLRMLPSPEVLNILEPLFRSLEIDTHIATFIDLGHASDEMYRVATGPYQFAEYLCAKRSITTGKLLFDEFMPVLEAAGKVTSPYPEPIFKTYRGYPLTHIGKELYNGHTSPFRVALFRATAERENGS